MKYALRLAMMHDASEPSLASVSGPVRPPGWGVTAAPGGGRAAGGGAEGARSSTGVLTGVIAAAAVVVAASLSSLRPTVNQTLPATIKLKQSDLLRIFLSLRSVFRINGP